MMKREVSKSNLKNIVISIFVLISFIEHQEFLRKRKEHYKNEMKAAQLLKR